jgi:hypothetical protein
VRSTEKRRCVGDGDIESDFVAIVNTCLCLTKTCEQIKSAATLTEWWH